MEVHNHGLIVTVQILGGVCDDVRVYLDGKEVEFQLDLIDWDNITSEMREADIPDEDWDSIVVNERRYDKEYGDPLWNRES